MALFHMNLTLALILSARDLSLFEFEDPRKEKEMLAKCPGVLASTRRVADSVQITILGAAAPLVLRL